MARDVIIPGECLVQVKVPDHIAAALQLPEEDDNIVELGLSAPDALVFRPRWRHREVFVDDYGPEVPAERISRMASAEITMTLTHFDQNVLDYCLGEAMGGIEMGAGLSPAPTNLGTLNPAGTMFGDNKVLYASGNHYIGLGIVTNGTQVSPYFFPSAYLTDRPLDFPLGVSRQAVRLSWTAIPYGRMNTSGEISSSGAVLFLRGINYTPS